MGRVLTIYLNDARLKLLGGDEGSVSLQKRIYALIDELCMRNLPPISVQSDPQEPGDSPLPGDGGQS